MKQIHNTITCVLLCMGVASTLPLHALSIDTIKQALSSKQAKVPEIIAAATGSVIVIAGLFILIRAARANHQDAQAEKLQKEADDLLDKLDDSIDKIDINEILRAQLEDTTPSKIRNIFDQAANDEIITPQEKEFLQKQSPQDILDAANNFAYYMDVIPQDPLSYTAFTYSMMDPKTQEDMISDVRTNADPQTPQEVDALNAVILALKTPARAAAATHDVTVKTRALEAARTAIKNDPELATILTRISTQAMSNPALSNEYDARFDNFEYVRNVLHASETTFSIDPFIAQFIALTPKQQLNTTFKDNDEFGPSAERSLFSGIVSQQDIVTEIQAKLRELTRSNARDEYLASLRNTTEVGQPQNSVQRITEPEQSEPKEFEE